ncbi:MAG: hypothetical protein AAGH76_10405 [Pseudomonadota bacterium]
MTHRLAMWSGPRNISTAMMRAFEARGDCAVVDEPFYAAYLSISGAVHPMQAAVLASQPQAPADVVAQLSAPLPNDVALQYQKQMTHHVVFDLDERWLASLSHAFLIRNPAAMIASYLHKRASVEPDDLGVARQRAIFETITRVTGKEPPIIAAEDILRQPSTALARLCDAVSIPRSDSMYTWPAGRRSTDGVWAPHWYGAVEASTGFKPFEPSEPVLSGAAKRVLAACEPDYRFLYERRLHVT